MDRLAWDHGDPSGEMKAFNQNCVTQDADRPCDDFHPMKGPMVTQTMQDIIGNEPLHWRGDRDGIEEFNAAFPGLLGADAQLTASEMQRFKAYLSTLTFPPNPFRQLDNSLPTDLPLEGHFTTGAFGRPGEPLGNGNARRGLELYTNGQLDDPFECASCHTLPTGMAVNGPILINGQAAGGSIMPDGPNGENHLGVVTVDGSTNRAIKVAQLRNLYEKVGFDTTQTDNRAGFGFLHDGTTDSLARFVTQSAFEIGSRQEVADLVALMLAFSGSDFGDANPPLSAPVPLSQDTHAAVGRQWTLTSGSVGNELQTVLREADLGRVDMIARSATHSWVYRSGDGVFDAGDGGERPGITALADGGPVTLTAVPVGLGERLGIDRDGDGLADVVELTIGANPTDPTSTTLRPATGLWYNPARSGHGLDVELLGEFMFVTWYTYEDDGSPTWYQAVAPFAEAWTAELVRHEADPEGGVTGTTVGTMALEFTSTSSATWRWELGDRCGTEAMEVLPLSIDRTLRNYTGTWYDPLDSGWGLTLAVGGDVRVGVLYYYDAERQPRWALCQSDNAAENAMTMLSFSGFCPDCDRTEPTFVDAGAVTYRFDSLRTAAFSSAVTFPGAVGGSWTKDVAGFVPLNDPPQDNSRF
ncbi:MAG: hypothetical protein AAGE01_07220 [Pseudomonadota bacterium]